MTTQAIARLILLSEIVNRKPLGLEYLPPAEKDAIAKALGTGHAKELSELADLALHVYFQPDSDDNDERTLQTYIQASLRRMDSVLQSNAITRKVFSYGEHSKNIFTELARTMEVHFDDKGIDQENLFPLAQAIEDKFNTYDETGVLRFLEGGDYALTEEQAHDFIERYVVTSIIELVTKQFADVRYNFKSATLQESYTELQRELPLALNLFYDEHHRDVVVSSRNTEPEVVSNERLELVRCLYDVILKQACSPRFPNTLNQDFLAKDVPFSKMLMLIETYYEHYSQPSKAAQFNPAIDQNSDDSSDTIVEIQQDITTNPTVLQRVMKKTSELSKNLVGGGARGAKKVKQFAGKVLPSKAAQKHNSELSNQDQSDEDAVMAAAREAEAARASGEPVQPVRKKDRKVVEESSEDSFEDVNDSNSQNIQDDTLEDSIERKEPELEQSSEISEHEVDSEENQAAKIEPALEKLAADPRVSADEANKNAADDSAEKANEKKPARRKSRLVAPPKRGTEQRPEVKKPNVAPAPEGTAANMTLAGTISNLQQPAQTPATEVSPGLAQSQVIAQQPDVAEEPFSENDPALNQEDIENMFPSM